MQIVIDIPDYTYEAVKEFVKEGLFDYNGINATLHKSVANGTVLPKGHGRLVDVGQKNMILRGILYTNLQIIVVIWIITFIVGLILGIAIGKGYGDTNLGKNDINDR